MDRLIKSRGRLIKIMDTHPKCLVSMRKIWNRNTKSMKNLFKGLSRKISG